MSISGSTDVSRRSEGKRANMFVLDADFTVRSGTISSELIVYLSLELWEKIEIFKIKSRLIKENYFLSVSCCMFRIKQLTRSIHFPFLVGPREYRTT